MNAFTSEPLPRLAEPLILYADDSETSRQAEKMLRDAGLDPFVVDGPVEPMHLKPIVIVWGACYEGVPAIAGLIRLLRHWHRTGMGDRVFIRATRTAIQQTTGDQK